jgi:hypothetical protein
VLRDDSRAVGPLQARRASPVAGVPNTFPSGEAPMAEKTTVSLTAKDLAHFELDPKKLGDLEKGVLAKLKPLKVSKVSAEIIGGGKAVKFILEAPDAVDPAAVKKALR